MKPILPAAQAVEDVNDGASILIGGFMCCGQSLGLIDALLDKGTRGLTLICNDAGVPGKGIAKLISAGRVKHLIASHIGLNPEAGKKMNSGEMRVDLVPQGTLIERIRCAGAGLGGVLTPTGLGTEVEQGKQRLSVDGRDYLLEKPLHADFAFVKASIADAWGNCFIAKSMKNFNIPMASAAKITLVEAKQIVALGEIDQDRVNLPGVFVQRLVKIP
jgi:acetate CoA/acetoacetate CoA-transferase alpha subunit